MDANYSYDIEDKEIFNDICEYHLDSVNYWKNKKVHHPFMQKNDKGDGKVFHRGFSNIELSECYADQITFMELVNKPTVGRNKITIDDLDMKHLDFIKQVIFSESTKAVFICDTVAKIMKKTHQFDWLNLNCIKTKNDLNIYYDDNNITVYKHLHFSNYRKFQDQKNQEAKSIFKIITEA